MPHQVLICDDSGFARRQMARALPERWDIAIRYAGDGEECLAALRQAPSDILFLDLNMPGMDGYEVLEQIRRQDLNTTVIVVSGDIQPEARERVRKLGAMEFIKKPISVDVLNPVLERYGLLAMFDGKRGYSRPEVDFAVDFRDGYLEITNIAMGRATDLLARYFNTFLNMPEPNISTVEASDVQMILGDLDNSQTLSAVCQGFIAPAIAGEAMVLLHNPDLKQIARDMELDTEHGNAELDLAMDIAGILIGAFIGSLRDLLKTSFSQGQPIVLGQHITLHELQNQLRNNWHKTLCMEIPYAVEKYNLRCDLIVFFAEEAIPALEHKVSQLIA